MFSKYYSLILALNLYFVDCLIFSMVNVFRYLNEELDSLPIKESKRNIENIHTRWIEQELDHFDSKETRNWKMRYFERLDYWKYNGPIYLLIGGEFESSWNWTCNGLMSDLAKETNGAMYVSEHRYYGESIPLNVSSTRDFKFLNSRQAIADIAKLLKSMKSFPQYKTSKIVVIGGSYAGNLATWLKSLYPEIVDVALASSAPLLAKKDFFEYFEKVGDNYERYGTHGCIGTVREIFHRYDKLFQSVEGIDQLKKENNICEETDFSLPENKLIFFLEKVFPFANISQYSTVEDIKAHCKNLTKNIISEKLGFLKEPERTECQTYDFILSDLIIRLNYTRNHTNDLPWHYQTCTEFGYFQTSSGLHPFTNNFPIDLFINECTRLFGPEFNEQRVDNGIEDVNKFYGGLRPNVTKVIFTNGEIDPWSTLSISAETSNNNPLVILPKASHCRDLLAKVDDDEEIKRGIEYIKSIIKIWINAID